MIPKLRFNLTHWVDGMKIHKKHFVESEIALLDAIRDSSALPLTNFNYGLLTALPGEKKSIDVKILRAQSSNFQIILSACRAVTAGGVRVEILPGDAEVVCEDSVTVNINTGIGSVRPYAFLAVLTVDPFNRQPVGEPSVEEKPPRHPYTKPRYELHLVAEEEVAAQDFGSFHLPIARFETKGDVLVIDETYIPPCATIKGHNGMIQLYNTLGATFSHIQEFGSSIVQKVISKSQNTPLAQNIKRLCQQSLQCISSLFFAYRNMLPQQPPIFMLEHVVQLANILKLELDFMPEKEKEELLQYFKEWNEISPSAFEEMVSAVIELEYDHNAIYQSFLPAVVFATRWMQLLEKLSELELIGRRKEKDIFVGKVYQDKKKGFSLLD